MKLADDCKVRIGLTWSPNPSNLAEDLQEKLDEFLNSETDDRIKDVYACYGLAMFYAQCLEVGLHSVIVGYARAFGDLDVADVDTFADSFATETLGRLLSRLRELIDFDEHSEGLLKQALLERNRLAHRFFEERVEEMYGPRGQEIMVRELLNATQLFRYADLVFTPLISLIFQEIGISDDYLESQFALLEQQAEAKYGRSN